MDIKEVLISDLKLDPKNARKHNPKNLETVKYSLEKYGQQKNIVIDSAGNVVAGNGTVMAAKELGWSKLLANVTDLKGKDLIAYGLVDNRSAELAEWDEDVKKELLSSLAAQDVDIDKIGFDADEILKGAVLDLDSEEKTANTEDRQQMHCPKCGFIFEVTK